MENSRNTGDRKTIYQIIAPETLFSGENYVAHGKNTISVFDERNLFFSCFLQIKVSPAEGKEKQKLESRLRNGDRSSARCAAHCFLVDYLDPATHLETTKLSVKDIYEKYFKNYCDDYLDLKNENVVWK